MGFLDDEQGVATSQPIELWTFTTPSNTYRYTTSEVAIVFGGNTYTAIPGARSEDRFASADPPEKVLRLPTSNAFVQAYAFGMPDQVMTVQIRRLQGAASLITWQGDVEYFETVDKETKVISTSQLATPMDADIPSALVGPNCPHVLYDDRCTVNREAVGNVVSTTVATIIDEVTITIASIGTLSGKVKEGGEIVRQANGDRRLIMDQSGVTITFNAPFRTLAIGNSVKLYRSCRHDMAACVNDFSNGANFGGQPYMPNANPFDGLLVGNNWLGS